jgi:hypothetical protein
MQATAPDSAYCYKSSVCHPGDLIQQVWSGPAMEGQHRVLELLVSRPRTVHSGKNP